MFCVSETIIKKIIGGKIIQKDMDYSYCFLEF